MIRKFVKPLIDYDMEGLGKSIPPLKEYVKIYFLQKGCSEYEAMEFYRHFDAKQWTNNRGKILSNWKMAAWEWILKRFILKEVIEQ